MFTAYTKDSLALCSQITRRSKEGTENFSGAGHIWTPRRESLGLSANHTELGRRELLDCEVLSAGPRLPEVIGHLHTKPRFRARPERFREAEGHFD